MKNASAAFRIGSRFFLAALLATIPWQAFAQRTTEPEAKRTERAERTNRDRQRRAANRQPRVPDNVRVLRDIEYARPDGRPQLLDLYLPKTRPAKPQPLVVWIHGGAWRAGSKDRCPALWLTGEGFAVASISYRFSQVARFPAQINDCQAAIRYLREHAQTHQLDPNRFGVWGSSAGGHLSALVGVGGDADSLTGSAKTSSAVQAVCDFFGPTDFLQMDAHSTPNPRIVHDAANSPESQLVGGPIQEHRDRVALANPLTYISKADPPFLIMHGDRDPLVPLHQSQLLHAALEKAGVKSTLHVVEGGGHGFGGDDVRRRVREFFVAHLRPSASKPKEPSDGDAAQNEQRGEERRGAEQAEDKDPTPPFNPRTVIRRPFRAIVDAEFIDADDVTDQVRDNELVLGVVVNDAARAYPINMLCGPTREIVNDVLGKTNIAATW